MKEYEIEISRSQRNLDMDLPGDLVFGVPGNEGRGIVSVIRTAGNGAPGTMDTYTITYSDNTTSTFTVYNGADGKNGNTPVRGVDYWTDEDKAEIIRTMSAVLYTQQELTEEQKEQARKNIGATAINVSIKDGVLSIE